ncbi:MAG: hypothetical protein NUV98_01125, partial [Candidatus Roizmanbacteria bacterium]|nr:hypothetical protein [Candidatus Roizmanbacteria bacterium]
LHGSSIPVHAAGRAGGVGITVLFVRAPGLEPGTVRVSGECSTARSEEKNECLHLFFIRTTTLKAVPTAYKLSLCVIN